VKRSERAGWGFSFAPLKKNPTPASASLGRPSPQGGGESADTVPAIMADNVIWPASVMKNGTTLTVFEN
jgi:hypothetical protein